MVSLAHVDIFGSQHHFHGMLVVLKLHKLKTN